MTYQIKIKHAWESLNISNIYQCEDDWWFFSIVKWGNKSSFGEHFPIWRVEKRRKGSPNRMLTVCIWISKSGLLHAVKLPNKTITNTAPLSLVLSLILIYFASVIFKRKNRMTNTKMWTTIGYQYTCVFERRSDYATKRKIHKRHVIFKMYHHSKPVSRWEMFSIRTLRLNNCVKSSMTNSSTIMGCLFRVISRSLGVNNCGLSEDSYL